MKETGLIQPEDVEKVPLKRVFKLEHYQVPRSDGERGKRW
jgi:hypothetical protein